jgi:hypothetical protein
MKSSLITLKKKLVTFKNKLSITNFSGSSEKKQKAILYQEVDNLMCGLQVLWHPVFDLSFELSKLKRDSLEMKIFEREEQKRKQERKRVYIEIENPIEYCEKRIKYRLGCYVILKEGNRLYNNEFKILKKIKNTGKQQIDDKGN